MNASEPKRLLILRTLQALQKFSDEDHPLKQKDIAAILEREYGLSAERKAIGRAVASLQDCGYEVETSREGVYLRGRDFTDSELRMLIDGVLSSRYIPEKYSKDLIEKLCALSSVYFTSHVRHVYSVGDWSKSDNRAVFLNIELVDQAINEGRQLTFDYNKFGADKKLHKTASHRVSPYQLVLHNQRYYLISFEEHWQNMAYYRLDHITNMRLIDQPLTDIRRIEGFKNGVDYREFAGTRPYMFSDPAVRAEMAIDPSLTDAVIDWFGTDFKAGEMDDGRIKITLRVSPSAMEYWALQFINYVEVLSPQGLREKIAEDIRLGSEKYL